MKTKLKDNALVRATPGAAVSKKELERPDLDDILSQMTGDINRATALLTDRLVENIYLASPKSRKGILSAFSGFLKRLNEVKGDFYTKIISDGRI